MKVFVALFSMLMFSFLEFEEEKKQGGVVLHTNIRETTEKLIHFNLRIKNRKTAFLQRNLLNPTKNKTHLAFSTF